MKKDSKQAKALRSVHLRGYRVNERGEVISPYGVVRKLTTGKSPKEPYLVFNMKDADSATVRPIRVHGLLAYQIWGEEIFEHDCIRHLDGNPLNNTPGNLALGSHHDNAMDRPPDERRAHAAHAAKGRATDYDWSTIEKDYFEHGQGFKRLAKKYGMSLGTLSHHFNQLPGWHAPTTPDQFDWDGIKAHILSTDCSYTAASQKFGCSTKALLRRLGPRKSLH